jgi:hypothetical protein
MAGTLRRGRVVNAGPILLMLACAFTLAGAIAVYERLLATVRAERDELLDILDANIDDMRRLAQERHPVNYGGGNLRIVK